MLVDPILNKKFQLGEGLFWDHKNNLLMGVDIDSSQIWVLNNLNSFWTGSTPNKVGWIIRIDSTDSFLVGLKNEVSLFKFPNYYKHLDYLSFSHKNNIFMRSNDAKADVCGRIWGGVMSEVAPGLRDGYLYKVDLNGSIIIVDDGYGIPNGPAFSPDNSLMLHTDSWLRIIYIFDFNSKLGLIKNKRIWKKFGVEDGIPDGMCFDSQGFVWIAHWGSGKVCRYDIDGVLMMAYHLPVSQVSNVCFGGRYLDHLFVTTALVGLDSDQIKAQDLAGSLFKISNTGVFGLPPFLASSSFIHLFNAN